MFRRKPAYLKAREQFFRSDAKKSQTNLYLLQHSCDQCEFVGKTEKALELHKVVHQKERLLFCELCDFPVQEKSELIQHFQKNHTIPPKPVLISTYSVFA